MIPAPIIDADYVIARLQEAATTLQAIPNTGPSTRMRLRSLEVVRSQQEGYGWDRGAGPLRPAVPGAGAISRMDEAMSWQALIPDNQRVLRKIVNARAIVDPKTDRHAHSWRGIALEIGADVRAVQRWHGVGIRLIVAALNRRPA